MTVERGDDSWEVSEENLDELPEDVRGHVARFFNRNAWFAPNIVDLNEDGISWQREDRPRRVRIRTRRARRDEVRKARDEDEARDHERGDDDDRADDEDADDHAGDDDAHDHEHESRILEFLDDDFNIEIDGDEIADRVRELIDEHLGGFIDKLHEEHGELDRHREELDKRVDEQRRHIDERRRELEERVERRHAERQEEIHRHTERIEETIERHVRKLEEVIEREMPEIERIVERVIESLEEHLDHDHDHGDDDDDDDEEEDEEEDEDEGRSRHLGVTASPNAFVVESISPGDRVASPLRSDRSLFWGV